MNHHLLDCNIIVREPNRTSVLLAERGKGEEKHWGKAQVTGRPANYKRVLKPEWESSLP
jgi:hypothetical protein